jgi:hypothetical protein
MRRAILLAMAVWVVLIVLAAAAGVGPVRAALTVAAVAVLAAAMMAATMAAARMVAAKARMRAEATALKQEMMASTATPVTPATATAPLALRTEAFAKTPPCRGHHVDLEC